MDKENIVKTEIKLGEDTVRDILVSEVAKVVAQTPNLIEEFVRNALFYRPPKKYSYDDEKPTFFESTLKKTFQPLIEEEIKKVAEQNRDKLSAIIKDAFKTKVIDNKEFENRIIERLSKFSSNISFYISDN